MQVDRSFGFVLGMALLMGTWALYLNSELSNEPMKLRAEYQRGFTEAQMEEQIYCNEQLKKMLTSK